MNKNLLWLGALPLCAVLLPAHSQITVAGFTPGSFRVTESGAAEYRIPVRVVPGIAGMEPKLALVYNSQGGNGPLGIGWGLSGLSAIHRCGRTIVQDGANLGVTYTSTDRFCLDGQRLVAVNGVYGANGTEYRTERESYTKVVSYGSAGSGPAWFKAWTKAGQVMEYGNTTDSRIEAQGKSDVRIWAVSRISDTVGNYITATYNEDNANGDYSLSRVDYTGNAGQSVAAFASVRFAYASRTDVNPVFAGGSVVKTQSRLTNARTYLGETLVTDYRLAYIYAPNNGPSLVTSITECTPGDVCFAPLTFGWQTGTGIAGLEAATGWNGGGQAVAVGDVNGDGVPDVVWASANQVSGGGATLYLSLSNGSAPASAVSLGSFPSMETGGPICTEAGCSAYFYRPVPFALGDVNGDGRADLVYAGAIRLSAGSGFGSAISWSGGGGGLAVGDVNGDGYADVVWATASSTGGLGNVYLNLSTGSGFSGATFVGYLASESTGAAEGCSEVGCTSTYLRPRPFALGDINGDGRADLVSGGSIRFSTGSGFASATTWPHDPSGFALHDVNGDGFADAVWAGNNIYVPGSNLHVSFSDGNTLGIGLGSGTLPTEQLGQPSGCSEAGCTNSHVFPVSMSLGGVSGSGRGDLVYPGSFRAAVARTLDLITTITSSLGVATSITYKPLSDPSVYAKDSDAVWPTRDLHKEGPLYVVSSTSVPNLVSGSAATNHFYRGAKAHATGGGVIGFRQVESTDAQTLIKSVTTFRQTYPYHGVPLSSVRTQSSGAVLVQTSSTWTDTPFANSTGKYHKVELATSVESGNDLNGTALPTVTTSYSHDAYGNAQSVTVGTGDGYSKQTVNTYALADEVNWILGRLTQAQVTASSPVAPQLTRTSSFSYDPTTGLLVKEVVEPSSSSLCVVTVYQRDGFGNKTAATVRNCSGSTGEAAAPTGTAAFAARTSSTSYAVTTVNPTPGAFATSSTNALSQIETREYDSRFGTLTKLTGPNGLATTWAYDGFGRKTGEQRADGTSTTWSFQGCSACPPNGRYFVTETTTGVSPKIVYFDSLNREIRTQSTGFDGNPVFKDTEYNARGQVLRVSRPYRHGDSPAWMTFAYDDLGRVIAQTDANGAVTQLNYNGLVTTTTSALNQIEIRTKNSQGQLVQITRQ